MTPKEKMAIPPQPMPEQPPAVRARNMKEVALGYTAEMARTEASRCLNCPTKPCMEGCPVAVNIPGFLAKAALEIIEKDRAKHADLAANIARIDEQLAELG